MLSYLHLKKDKLCTNEGVWMSKLLCCQCIMVATTTTTMPPKLNNILLKEIPNIAQKNKHKSQIQEEPCKLKIVEDACLRIKIIETTCKIRASKKKTGPIAFNPPSLNT